MISKARCPLHASRLSRIFFNTVFNVLSIRSFVINITDEISLSLSLFLAKNCEKPLLHSVLINYRVYLASTQFAPPVRELGRDNLAKLIISAK